jgi:hypothetical protein
VVSPPRPTRPRGSALSGPLAGGVPPPDGFVGGGACRGVPAVPHRPRVSHAPVVPSYFISVRNIQLSC